MIDHYDSFTHNLRQQVASLGAEVLVKAHDQITLEEVEALNPERIILSPGPKDPASTVVTLPVIEAFYTRIPILGVCLGHQCLGAFFGARVVSARAIRHGKSSDITHKGDGLFEGIASPMTVARYHSLALDRVPDDFTLAAWAEDGEIMAMQHKEWPIFGVQFHPESFLTTEGNRLMTNFLNA